jgi:hypothetical protein
MGCGDDFAVEDNDGADGDFAKRLGQAGLFERQLHELLMVGIRHEALF